MKRIFSILLSCMMLALAGCGAEPPAPTETPMTSRSSAAEDGTEQPETGPYRVAALSGQASPELGASFVRRMERAAAPYMEAGLIGELDPRFTEPDLQMQIAQVEQAVADEYDLLVVSPTTGTGLDLAIQKAAEAGVTYVNMGSEYNSRDVVSVILDQREYARLNCQFVIDTLGSGTRVIMFSGEEGSTRSTIWEEVCREMLAEADITVVRTYYHNWDNKQARAAMQDVIDDRVIYDGVINDGGGDGILDAVQASGASYPDCITTTEGVAWARRIAALNRAEPVCPFIVTERAGGVGAVAMAVGISLRQGGQLDPGALDGEWNSVLVAPKWVMTRENIRERLEEISALEDTDPIFSARTVEEIQETYFLPMEN